MNLKNNHKPSMDLLHTEAKKRDGKLLSTRYVNSKIPLEWQCKHAHTFFQTYYRIKTNNAWYPKCKNNSRCEEMCRDFFERLFKLPFPKFRADWLRNQDSNKLELDGYCVELGIAFEHHGMQHYKANGVFVNPKAKQNDADKLLVCNKNNVNVIVIPQLFVLTKINDFKNIIKNKLQLFNINIPHNFNDIYLDLSINSNIDYCNKRLKIAHDIAKSYDGECLTNKYEHAFDKFKWSCKNKHIFISTFNSVVNNKTWCQKCYHLEQTKPIPNILKEELEDLYINKRLSIIEIANYLKTSINTTRKLFDKLNIQLLGGAHSKLHIDYNIIYDLYISQNKSCTEIGQIYNVDKTTIHRVLNEYNLITDVSFKFSKLSMRIIYEIIDKYKTGQYLQKNLAKEYNVSKKIIYNLLGGKIKFPGYEFFYFDDLKLIAKNQRLYNILKEKKKQFIITDEYLNREYFQNQRSMRDIASELGCSAATVSNAVNALKSLLKQEKAA